VSFYRIHISILDCFLEIRSARSPPGGAGLTAWSVDLAVSAGAPSKVRVP
jgi:hypothetical protein